MSRNVASRSSNTGPGAAPDRARDKAALLRRLRAARMLACDGTLDPRRHDSAVRVASQTARTLYIRHGIRV